MSLGGTPTVLDCDVPALLRGFRRRAVVVAGDVIHEAYLRGSASRLRREGPVPVLAVGDRSAAAGGAANVAVNLAALGARVEPRGVLCDDAGARVLEPTRAHRVLAGAEPARA